MSEKCDGYGESAHNYFLVLLGEGGSSDLSRNFTKGVDKRTLSNIFAKFVTVDKDKAEILYESGNRETQSRVKRRIARLFQSPSQKGPLIREGLSNNLLNSQTSKKFYMKMETEKHKNPKQNRPTISESFSEKGPLISVFRNLYRKIRGTYLII